MDRCVEMNDFVRVCRRGKGDENECPVGVVSWVRSVVTDSRVILSTGKTNDAARCSMVERKKKSDRKCEKDATVS